MSAITFADRDAWLAARRNYVTSTDIPIIMGLKSYKSVIRLWAEKVGLLEPKDYADQEWAVVGLAQEETVRKLYAHYTKRMVDSAPPWTLYVCDSFPRLAASIDHLACLPDSDQEFCVEGKAQESWRLDEWETDQGGPIDFVWQLQTQMLCRGDRMGSLCAVIGNKFRWWDHQAHADSQASIVDAASQFLAWVDNKEIPPADATRDCTAALLELYPVAEEMKWITLSDAIVANVAKLRVVKDKLKSLKVQETILRNTILRDMGDAAVGIDADGVPMCTVHHTKASKYTTIRRAGKMLRLAGDKEE